MSVSVTLSVNSPIDQTTQWIFTVDSLKDADLRKDVPFRGLDDELSHLGVKRLQNPHFGGLNRHFKPNMRKILTARLQEHRTEVESDLCIRLT